MTMEAYIKAKSQLLLELYQIHLGHSDEWYYYNDFVEKTYEIVRNAKRKFARMYDSPRYFYQFSCENEKIKDSMLLSGLEFMRNSLVESAKNMLEGENSDD